MTPGAAYSKHNSPSDPAETTQMKSIPYREAIGSLMYASIATHPNITFAISTLSQFLNNPSPAHWDAVKCVFRYLSGTKHLTLTYSGEQHNLVGYMDTDGALQEHRRAISGSAYCTSWIEEPFYGVPTNKNLSLFQQQKQNTLQPCMWQRKGYGCITS